MNSIDHLHISDMILELKAFTRFNELFPFNSGKMVPFHAKFIESNTVVYSWGQGDHMPLRNLWAKM